jgi:hypothetical protein
MHHGHLVDIGHYGAVEMSPILVLYLVWTIELICHCSGGECDGGGHGSGCDILLVKGKVDSLLHMNSIMCWDAQKLWGEGVKGGRNGLGYFLGSLYIHARCPKENLQMSLSLPSR